MKPDFEKWAVDNNEPVYSVLFDSDIETINQFAEEYAKQEAIEFALYQQGKLHKVKDGRRLNAWKRRFGKDYEEYQKFKDENIH